MTMLTSVLPCSKDSNRMAGLIMYGNDHLSAKPMAPGVGAIPVLRHFVVALQAAILLLQSYAGPRCFIPEHFLPEKYNYWRKVVPKQILHDAEVGPMDVETGHGSVECVICMNMVEVETTRARMVTPCNHIFHPPCLQRWMDVKMECPTCRTALPSP